MSLTTPLTQQATFLRVTINVKVMSVPKPSDNIKMFLRPHQHDNNTDSLKSDNKGESSVITKTNI